MLEGDWFAMDATSRHKAASVSVTSIGIPYSSYKTSISCSSAIIRATKEYPIERLSEFL